MTLKDLFRDELGELSAYRVPPNAPPIKLDANESPWSLPSEARERIHESLGNVDLHRYPDGTASAVRGLLAERFGGGPEEYLVGSGSDELIALLATAASKPRPGADRPSLVIPTPTFVMYRVTHHAHGWRVLEVALDEAWDLDVEQMTKAMSAGRPNLVYYASPNNPTGGRFHKSRLRQLVERFPQTLHVIDEAYGPFCDQTFGDWHEHYPQCVFLGTLSKIGFASVRVGWLRANAACIEQIDKVRQPFNMNALSQAVARLAFSELVPLIREQIGAITEERQALIEALDRYRSLQCYPSDANFVLVRYEGDVAWLCEALLERGIAIRRFKRGDPRLAHCVRITVGTPEEDQRLDEALKELIE